jgi:hypothetical protein
VAVASVVRRVQWQGTGAKADLIRLSSDGNAANVRAWRRVAGRGIESHALASSSSSLRSMVRTYGAVRTTVSTSMKIATAAAVPKSPPAIPSR